MNRTCQTKLHLRAIFLLLLALTGCFASPTTIEQKPVPLKSKPSEQVNSSNEAQNRADAAEATPTVTETVLPATNTTTATAVLPVGDADLTHLLTTHQLAPRYGEASLHLLENGQLLVWFDSAALFDLRSEALLRKTPVTTGPSDQKVVFTSNGIGLLRKAPPCMDGEWDTILEGVFPNKINCMDHPIILEQYDFNLNLINTLDLSQLFDLRFDLQRSIQCALSQSGEQIVCAKMETGQVLLYDLQTKTQEIVFDFSWTNISSFRGIDSLTFAGNDQYLAFTALDEAGQDYGIIDLKQNQLVEFTKWNAIAKDIQTTENAVFFHEQLRGPQFPESGKMFEINLETMEKREIQFADNEESEYVTVSPTGKYIATVTDTAPTGAAFVAGSIKIYDGETMDLLREINLERGFPHLVIDETHRFLIAYYLVDGAPKLVRYAF